MTNKSKENIGLITGLATSLILVIISVFLGYTLSEISESNKNNALIVKELTKTTTILTGEIDKGEDREKDIDKNANNILANKNQIDSLKVQNILLKSKTNQIEKDVKELKLGL